MVAWVSKEALEKTLNTGWATYYSRSRQEIWVKGETSGNRQRIIHVRLDCDGDTLLLQVEQHGAACHVGYKSCFFRSIDNSDDGCSITEDRLVDPDEVYGKK